MGELIRALAALIWALSVLGLLGLLFALVWVAEWPWCLGPLVLVVPFFIWGESWVKEIHRAAGIDDGR